MTDMKTKVPVVSLGVMVGDEHAGAPLERCLRSVLEKKSGCPVDEIVIGFNGANNEQLEGTLKKLGYQKGWTLDDCKPGHMGCWWTTSPIYSRPPLKLVCFEWPGRFDVARNQYWPHLSGEWLLSMDADDILTDGGTEEGLAAIRAVERDYGMEPAKIGRDEKPIPFQQWLGSLPPSINVIFIGYDYQIDENGYVLVRQKTKRLVRRSLGHIWYSPDESGIHEVLTVVGPVPENGISNLGILLRHFPSQTDNERAARNTTIVARLTKGDVPTDARHAYDTANAQVVQGDLQRAEQSMLIAVKQAPNELDAYTYRLAYTSLLLARGASDGALQTALTAVGVNPDFQEAYFLAAEAFYRVGKWASVIEFYERGLSKAPVLLSKDQPLMRFIQPRGLAADAYLQLGNSEKALKLAEECMQRYPKSPLSQLVFNKASQTARTDKLYNTLFDSLEGLTEDAPTFAKMVVDMLPHFAATRGISKALRMRGLREKLNRMAPKRPHMPPAVVDAEWECADRIDLEDALREANAANMQLLKFEQRTSKKAVVRTRPRVGPAVSFYSPAAISLWSPQFLETHGLGGSESSVAYLARELSKLGHPVEVYTPHPGGADAMNLWSGSHEGTDFSVVQKSLTLVHEAAKSDIIVPCRAPYLAREMRELWSQGSARIFSWHQDNGYGNDWLWSKDIAEMQQHLHVSEWAMRGLVREAYTGVTADKPWDVPRNVIVPPLTEAQISRHFVLGNGIPRECLEGWDKVERKKNRVIYASDPSRGLEVLLEKWPLVRELVPDAELHLYCGYKVMLSLQQDAPGMPAVQRIRAIEQRVKEMEPLGVKYVGWRPQAEVIQAMKSANVYAYPGGPMPEGFGVSLVQAKACGCEVMCKDEGALPAVLPRRTVISSNDDLPALIVNSFGEPLSDESRREGAEEVFAMHGWPTVAKRFLEFVR